MLAYPTLAFPFTNSYDKLKLQDKRGFISLFKLMDLPHCTKSLIVVIVLSKSYASLGHRVSTIASIA